MKNEKDVKALAMFKQNQKKVQDILNLPLEECLKGLYELRDATNLLLRSEEDISIEELINTEESVYVEELMVQSNQIDQSIDKVFTAINHLKSIWLTSNYTID